MSESCFLYLALIISICIFWLITFIVNNNIEIYKENKYKRFLFKIYFNKKIIISLVFNEELFVSVEKRKNLLYSLKSNITYWDNCYYTIINTGRRRL